MRCCFNTYSTFRIKCFSPYVLTFRVVGTEFKVLIDTEP